eukprot:12371175-Alexandrium_andersonii.AAC.1
MRGTLVCTECQTVRATFDVHVAVLAKHGGRTGWCQERANAEACRLGSKPKEQPRRGPSAMDPPLAGCKGRARERPTPST